MLELIRKQYGPVFNLHINGITVAGMFIKNLDRPLHEDVKEEVRTYCSPNATSIEFNIYGGAENSIEIAETTTSNLLTGKGHLKLRGWCKLFQLERQVVAVGVSNLRQVILFSMDKEDIFDKHYHIFPSFPALHQCWQNNILKHMRWTEQLWA